MTHVLLASLGSSGDVQPFFAIGQALKEKGVTPVFLLNPKDVEKGRALGFRTERVGKHLACRAARFLHGDCQVRI